MRHRHSLRKRQTRLLRRQVVASRAQKRLHLSPQRSVENPIRGRSWLPVQGRFPHLVKRLRVLDRILHHVLVPEEQDVLLLGVPGFQLQLLQDSHDGLLIRPRLRYVLPSLLHPHYGRPVAQGARWPLHLEQQLPPVRQVDDREHGSALLQLHRWLRSVVQEIRYLLLHCLVDGRQPWHVLKR